MQETGADSGELVSSRLKKKYRDQIKMLYDILAVCRQGALISRICREANLSHYVAKPPVKKLAKLGYLTFHDTGRLARSGPVIEYKTTPKGYLLMDAIGEFANA